MAVSRRLRFEILRRDGHTCRYCGATAPDVPLTVDHVLPVALGGTDEPTNLVTACKDCNSGKTSVAPGAPLVADIEKDALRWARAITEVVRTRRLEQDYIDGIVEMCDDQWNQWRFGLDGNGKPIRAPRPTDWIDSVGRFVSLGLNADTLIRHTDIAMRKKGVPIAERWNYFCGCCWRYLDDVQADARKVLEFEDQWKKEVTAE